ncbi:MAG: aminotransferase class IV [Deltaproteobacteria bacterium]|jgi:4-amino-4-deoxychorismate lyase|nr:aminotransferase class IV [Deltaproteobacteria bacterium]
METVAPVFLETIKWDGSAYRNLPLHEERLKRTFRKYFRRDPGFRLAEALPANPGPGLIRTRLVYSEDSQSVATLPYVFPAIQNAALIDSDVYYGEKFLDRESLNALKAKTRADEIIIVKEGLLTDSSIANLVFAGRDGQLYTPEPPLLFGVKRAALLRAGKVRTRAIRPCDLREFEWLSFVNAMIDLEDEIRIPTQAIWPRP